MAAGDVRQNAGLRIERFAVVAILAPQQERWRSSDQKALSNGWGDHYPPPWTGEPEGYLGIVSLGWSSAPARRVRASGGLFGIRAGEAGGVVAAAHGG